MGKGFFHGLVLYRDIFDQKGAYLYFFYGLAYLISHTTSFGIFVLEIVEGFFCLWGFYKILCLYAKEKTSLMLCPFIFALSVSAPCFYWGGSAEEMNLPFIIWGLYLILFYFKEKYPNGETMDKKTLLLGGFLAGMVANIKFIDLGFFFAWMMCVFFAFVALKQVKEGFVACIVFLFGMAIPFVPWFIYFWANGALYDWYFACIHVNLFVYSNFGTEGPSLLERIVTLIKMFYFQTEINFVFFVFLIPGIFYYAFGKKRKWLDRFQICALFGFLFLCIYIGGSTLGYYALPFSAFTVMGFIPIGQLIDWTITKWSLNEKLNTNKKMIMNHGLRLGAIVISMFIIWCCSNNIPYMKVKKEDHVLFRMKEYVKNIEDPTIMNFNCLDTGLGTILDAMPACRWFQTQPIAIDDIYLEQKDYMRAGIPKIVVVEGEYPPHSALQVYDIVAEETWNDGNGDDTYYLLVRKDLVKDLGK